MAMTKEQGGKSDRVSAPHPEQRRSAADAAGGAEGGMPEGSAGGPGQGNTLKDASEEAVKHLQQRTDGRGHAGSGDIG